MAFKFENLGIWKRAIDYSEMIHNVTLSFPKTELFLLTHQLKKNADGIALKIAEGSSAKNPEFKQHLNVAIRYAMNIISCLYIAKKRQLIDLALFKLLYQEAGELIHMIRRFRQTL